MRGLTASALLLAIITSAATSSLQARPQQAPSPAKRAPSQPQRAVVAMEVRAPFGHGEWIPKKHTCDGEDASPSLSWTAVECQCYAIICQDPDAPGGTFTHWVAYDIMTKAPAVHENQPKTWKLHHQRQGTNDFGRPGYSGPCPPPGAPHHYHFRVYALDTYLRLPEGATASQLLAAMRGHILGQGELVGLYGRR